MPDTIPLLDFRAAREYFQALVPMTDEEWELVAEEIRRRAFTIANVSGMEVLLEVYGQMERRFTEGITFEKFQEEVISAIEDNGWIGLDPWQYRNVFDNNIQTAYGYGRLVQHTDMQDLYPYGEYVTVGDDRVRVHHRALEGRIALMTSKFWQDHYPPWEFR